MIFFDFKSNAIGEWCVLVDNEELFYIYLNA